jgi:hypothetical protein
VTAAKAPALACLVVPPVMRTVRDTLTELPLGIEEGLPEPCAATFDNLQPIRRSLLILARAAEHPACPLARTAAKL